MHKIRSEEDFMTNSKRFSKYSYRINKSIGTRKRLNSYSDKKRKKIKDCNPRVNNFDLDFRTVHYTYSYTPVVVHTRSAEDRRSKRKTIYKVSVCLECIIIH